VIAKDRAPAVRRPATLPLVEPAPARELPREPLSYCAACGFVMAGLPGLLGPEAHRPLCPDPQGRIQPAEG
jgi:hypothetical protein